MCVGERIKIRRIELNMTQDELARRLGYKSRSSINKIELSHADPPLSKIEEIAKALECEATYLMGWSEQNGSESLVEKQIEEACAILRDMPPEARALALASVKGIALQAKSQDLLGGSA